MPASRLVESVASTTSHRDRDDLSASIAHLLVEFMRAKAVAIYRLHDDDKVVRVARQVAVLREQGRQGSDDLGDLSKLPALEAVPAWRDCVREVRAVAYTAEDGGTREVFPIESEQSVVGMREIEPACVEPSWIGVLDADKFKSINEI